MRSDQVRNYKREQTEFVLCLSTLNQTQIHLTQNFDDFSKKVNITKTKLFDKVQIS